MHSPDTTNPQAVIDKALSFQHGGMNRNELETLYEMCRGARVIEVGSMVGMSSYVIASVCESLYCVDLWADAHQHIEPRQRAIYEAFSASSPNMYAQFLSNMAPFIGKNVTLLRGLSYDMAAQIPDKCANIILIDADHSREGVARDYAAYKPKLASGGYIVFHDYGSAMWGGVKEFVDAQTELQLVGQVDYLAAFTVKQQ